MYITLLVHQIFYSNQKGSEIMSTPEHQIQTKEGKKPPTLSGTFNSNVLKSINMLGVETSMGLYMLIFSFLRFNEKKKYHLRTINRLFRNVFKPPPLWTSFPHPEFATLTELVSRLNEVYAKDPLQAPTLVFVMQGTFHRNSSVEIQTSIRYPMKIIGAGQNKTFLSGYGFQISGTKETGKRVELIGMTVSNSKGCGLYGNNGLSFLCDSMTFTQCRFSGVAATETKGRLRNCVITQCQQSGICSHHNAVIEVEGCLTKVEGNVKSGRTRQYGLRTSAELSFVHLLSPLTKESVSKNNRNGKNYGGLVGGGMIETVNVFGKSEEAENM